MAWRHSCGPFRAGWAVPASLRGLGAGEIRGLRAEIEFGLQGLQLGADFTRSSTSKPVPKGFEIPRHEVRWALPLPWKSAERLSLCFLNKPSLAQSGPWFEDDSTFGVYAVAVA